MELLLPGMYVRAVIGNGERQALLVPQPAVQRDAKGNAHVPGGRQRTARSSAA
jgi:membrane fusion protein (multidrug efflux system)